MKVLDYTDKESKKKARAVDAQSILDDMDNLEALEGSSERKVYEHWYALKRELVAALSAEEGKKDGQ